MTLSTRKAWFSAPRSNFSSRRRRKIGVTPGGDADVERERRRPRPGQERRVDEHHRQEDEGEEEIDHEGERRAGEEIADVLELAHPRHACRRRAAPGNRRAAGRADGGRAARPARHRCGSWCARRDRSAASPSTASKIEIVTSPSTSTSRVLRPRWTSTLSMTTWKKSGVTSAKSCRKNEATSTSLSRPRYLWMAPRNQVMSKRRVRSVSGARRVISTRRPSQTALELGLGHQLRAAAIAAPGR